MKQTQLDRVVKKLNEEGSVDNFWAFNNYILRLGAIIFELKSQGWDFYGSFGTGRDRKNFIYRVTKRPKLTKDEIVEIAGKTAVVNGKLLEIYKPTKPKVDEKEINKLF